jgi:TorA maturation chaperone TorD
MEINYSVLSLAFRFYARSLQFPFDEQTHEYQHLFREMEKQVITDIDEEFAAKILDVLNYYQGEEMSSMQAEYSRLFAYSQSDIPLVPLFSSHYISPEKRDKLVDALIDSAIPIDVTDDVDSIQNILDYFAYLLEEGLEQEMDDFFYDYIDIIVPAFCANLYQGTIINFYKEVAKGLNSMIQELRPSQAES